MRAVDNLETAVSLVPVPLSPSVPATLLPEESCPARPQGWLPGFNSTVISGDETKEQTSACIIQNVEMNI